MNRVGYHRDEKNKLKERILAIVNLLPPSPHRKVFEKAPRYATLAGRDKIKNVLRLKSTDPKLTKILEQIAAEYQEELKNQVPVENNKQ